MKTPLEEDLQAVRREVRNLRYDIWLQNGPMLGNLFLLFLGLKLGDIIDWSWWYVFSPFMANPLLYFFLFKPSVASMIAARDEHYAKSDHE